MTDGRLGTSAFLSPLRHHSIVASAYVHVSFRTGNAIDPGHAKPCRFAADPTERTQRNDFELYGVLSCTAQRRSFSLTRLDRCYLKILRGARNGREAATSLTANYRFLSGLILSAVITAIPILEPVEPQCF